MWRVLQARSAAHRQRLGSVFVMLIGLGLAACGGSPGHTAAPQQDEDMPQLLQSDEVAAIMRSAARAVNQEMAVAVTDRRGVILGVGTNFAIDYPTDCAACPAAAISPAAACADCGVVNLVIQLARTAAFFSADQTPLTSRSVRFLSGEHFPPGIRNTAAAALFGIENTNRGCSFDTTSNPIEATIPRARSLLAQINNQSCDAINGVTGCTTGIATLPGGVPIYKNGRMSGGAGVAVRGVVPGPDPVAAFDDTRILRRSDANGAFTTAEFAARAFAGDAVGFPTLEPKGLKGVCNEANPPACCHPATGPACVLDILPARALPFDPVIFVDGVEIPEVDSDPPVSGVGQGRPLIEPFIVGAAASTAPAASQCLVGSDAACNVVLDPTVHDVPGLLTLEEAQRVIAAALAQAQITRAAIRLPLEARTAMVLAVSDIQGNLIGLFRMSDATVFSIDVAVAKSRNVIYFSSPTINSQDTMDCPGLSDCRGQAFAPGTAMTNRTLSFAAQPFFPSGIDGSLPGPFRRIFISDAAAPCTNGGEPTNGRQNGIVFFPGSAPLYRNGVLVGGFGVSGDGVEQDDLVTFAGTQALTSTGGAFEPPPAIRADQVFVRGVRLPYLKFNRQPEQ